MTEPGGRVWKQTIFHPFGLTARHATGDVLRLAVASPMHETAKFGEVATVDAVATHDPATGEVVLFATNRSVTEDVVLDVDLRGFPNLRVVEALTLANPDRTWAATADDDTSVAPWANTSARVVDDRAHVELPPVSWSIIRLSRA